MKQEGTNETVTAGASKNRWKRSLWVYLVMGFLSAVTASWWLSRKEEPTIRDYDEICASGILRVTTEYRPLDFQVEGDSLVGFHHDLLMAFARDHQLEIQFLPEMDLQKQLEGLRQGTYDLIAQSLLRTREYTDTLLTFTEPILITKQVLVQRKAESEEDSLFIHDQLELDGKTLYIPKASPVSQRIAHLSKETGDSISICESEKYGAEQLVALVAAGEIDYTVCDLSLAKAMLADFPNLDLHTEISFNQFYAWGLHKDAPVLRDSLNQWLSHYKQTSAYKQLLKKYKK